MSNIVRAGEPAELTDPYWLDSPVLGHGTSTCTHDRPEPSRSREATLRMVLVGVASGLIVVGLAVALMG
ncbi:hypothetical protein [Streptomyces sp. BH055]|uniref:hypothetical protein n=1 Tax=Streptomyces sp. BH055 TaxID=3401173 RepID=UPI003BB5EBF6